MKTLADMQLHGSPFVPVGQMYEMHGYLFFHSRVSVRSRRRRPHGRTNGPRRWKVRRVRYQPELDRLIAVTSRTEKL